MLDYQEFLPTRAVASVVKCIWALRGSAPRRSGAGQLPPDKIVPDGHPEIVLNFADPFAELHRDGELRRQATILVAGQMTRPLLLRPTGEIDLVGVRLRCDGLHALLGVPAAELLDQRVDLAAVDARLALRLQRAARASGSRIARVQAVIADALGERRAPTRAPWLPRAIEILRRPGPTPRMETLAHELDVTPRSLQRRFLHEVGAPAKTLARVFRFQRIYSAVEGHAGHDFTGLALDCGYYDQSHLIRDFRQFAGRTPASGDDDRELLAKLFSLGKEDRTGLPAAPPVR